MNVTVSPHETATAQNALPQIVPRSRAKALRDNLTALKYIAIFTGVAFGILMIAIVIEKAFESHPGGTAGQQTGNSSLAGYQDGVAWVQGQEASQMQLPNLTAALEVNGITPAQGDALYVQLCTAFTDGTFIGPVYLTEAQIPGFIQGCADGWPK
jgi:hypothetical protein